MRRIALAAGITGIGGNHVARELLNNGWDVVGLSRRAPRDLPGVRHIAADPNSIAWPRRGTLSSTWEGRWKS